MAFCAGVGFAMLGLRVGLSTNPTLVAIACGYTVITVYYTMIRREPLVCPLKSGPP
jgi:hypothetical protein